MRSFSLSPLRLWRFKCASWSPCEGVSSQRVCNPSFINVLLSLGSGSLLQRQLLKVITQAETNKAHGKPPFGSLCTVTRPGLTANKGGLTQTPFLPSKGKLFQLQWFLNEIYCTEYRFFIPQPLIGPNIRRPARRDLLLYLAKITRKSIFFLSIVCWGCYFEEDVLKLTTWYSPESWH